MALAVLGFFVFELKTAPFLTMQEDKEYRYAFNNRVGKRPSFQFLGQSNDPLTLTGVLYPELTGGRLSLYALELMAETGGAWPLIGGDGAIYGMHIIEGITRNKSIFFKDGAARKIEFTLKLKRVDESLTDMFGDLSNQLDSLMNDTVTKVKDTLGGIL